MKNSCILVISDTHIPYHHKDSIDFLKAIKKKYKPDRVIHIGDEVDSHAISFHDSDPDLYSAGYEHQMSLPVIKELEKIFPVMDLMDSNHGSLVYRRQKASGLPRAAMKSYNEYLDVGDGWTWHDDLMIRMSNGQDCYFCHGKFANVLKVAQQYGCPTVQGHYHSSFNIQYWGNPNSLNWGMQVGCLIDSDSLAFEYMKTQKSRPIIGCGIIIDGIPKLLPMVLNKGGKWNQKLT
mgnify:FL=1|tara:strand:+ start:84 stop:788 length:705 start_codon:yes stop_codon:yes gene_type:complete